ncbi:MAG TPA: Druantia anti-phage system protein DruA, partial [Pyrinomonadaceae bacterium]
MESFYKQASLDLKPTLPGELLERFAQFCLSLKESIEDCADNVRGAMLARFREDVHRCAGVSGDEKIDLMFAESLVLDLVAQDWRIDVEGGRVRIVAPSEEDVHRADKDRIRRGHLLGRDAQLKEPSVTEFVRGMERRRLTSKGWHSIFSLMRDGADLAQQLRRINEIRDEKVRDEALSQTIAPYIQCFDREDVCEHTGLKLGDVWRYFRHTWVSEYKSIPGRSMMALVRDAAVPNHPVIGIAALGSSVVQHGLRDKWIGWHPETFLKQVTEHPTAKVAKWLLKSLVDLTEAIYADDLRAEGLLSDGDFENPAEAVITRLLKESEKDIREHRTKPQREVLKVAETDVPDDSSWERASLTYLFRSKRCKQLAALLSVRKTFIRCGLTSGNRKGLKAA